VVFVAQVVINEIKIHWIFIQQTQLLDI